MLIFRVLCRKLPFDSFQYKPFLTPRTLHLGVLKCEKQHKEGIYEKNERICCIFQHFVQIYAFVPNWSLSPVTYNNKIGNLNNLEVNTKILFESLSRAILKLTSSFITMERFRAWQPDARPFTVKFTDIFTVYCFHSKSLSQILGGISGAQSVDPNK